MTQHLEFRTVLIKCYNLCELHADLQPGSNQIQVTATLDSSYDIHAFACKGHSTFDLTPYVGVRNSMLFWDDTGGQNRQYKGFQKVWVEKSHERQTLEVEFDDSRTHFLRLDNRLDVVPYYDPVSKLSFLRLGLKPKRSKRSIVLCFDGTANHFSKQNTNIVKMMELLKKSNPSEQVFYAKVIDGYRYLMDTYQEGDQISIFGFSRGAYTARALAGMLHAALALDETRGHFIPSVWDHARTRHEHGQTAVEVWFKGSHTDVGGGSPLTDVTRRNIASRAISKGFNMIRQRFNSLIKRLQWVKDSGRQNGDPIPENEPPNDDTPARLPDMSYISLRWMVHQIVSIPELFIIFDPYSLNCYRRAQILDRPAEGDQEKAEQDVTSKRHSLDDFDAQKDPYEATEGSPWWWLLEILPVPKLSQRNKNRSEIGTTYRPNIGAGRWIHNFPGDSIRLHSSAHHQKSAKAYTPKAKWQEESIAVIEDPRG
ncbi:hypothetical protein RhiXN_12075 [Rhizoctonia solani]|uniref:T6SS Phospholipase effector Tle1-like catalytic domain-containing protein n=1 Tax=Rhizoctonia solani TaxID=456999 RepID=A0A8H8T218_9AGAM|nr:uncharacterized protein RhiXN_12075 [Rhizoctonia solani]QRW26414.1 hypothetical protein RhiXN_12075 [Rhizoctonia solani]